MAGNGRKPTQQNKLLEDQIQEQRARVDSQVKEEHKRWCALIAERRAAARLTISQLAKIAGVDQRTIKNIEHEICQSIAPATLNRLRSVPQLRLPITLDTDSPHSAPGYQAIWLPDYNPSYASELAQSALKWRWDRFPYFALQHSKSSTDLYQFLISCGSYGDWLNEAHQGVEQMVSCFNQWVEDPFDLICLTIGHGWTELRIAESLLSDQSNRLTNVVLVSPNVHLLHHGLHVFKRQMYIPSECQSKLSIVLGNHDDYIDKLFPNVPQRRVFLILGALMNHDSGEKLLRSITLKARPGDLMAFDINLPFGELDNKSEIVRRDPRLSGQLPLSYIESVEKALEPAIRELDSTIARIDWHYGLDSSQNDQGKNLETYSVDMRARILREHMAPQDVSVLRIHRHSPLELEMALGSRHWTLRNRLPMGATSEINYPSELLLFVKNT